VSADSPALVQLGSDIDKLHVLVNTRPRHDLALAVLDAAQKAKLAAALELASEAIEIGLNHAPLKGEILCH
jgi:hypothetical protein